MCNKLLKKGSTNVEKLKTDLAECSSSLNVAISANITLTDNNKALEYEISKLKEQNKALKVEVGFVREKCLVAKEKQ